MLNERWYPVRVVILLLVAMAVSMCALNASAQNERNKTFPLNKPFVDTFVFCVSEVDATDIINADIQREKKPKGEIGYKTLEEVFAEKMMANKCGAMQAEVTYIKLKLRLLSPSGVKLSVYEAKVSGVTIFVPMRIWVADNEITI